jgi:hypothetical protein
LDVLSALLKPANDSVRVRTARLAAYTATSCSIDLAGSTVSGVPYLTSYAPAVGHAVVVLQTPGGLLIVLGRTA